MEASLGGILARARLQLICERGKAALGEGNNSIGDIVPSPFAERDIVDVCVYLNDRVDIFLPPYNSPAQTRRDRRACRLQGSRLLFRLDPRGHAPIFPCRRWS
jgi:hypothetical protein